ncbi:hypothetical protein [Streptomyces clavifer]|uniref:hypothetical protein n=1 Tax=Streptomyces clavifer TaxID=68188 RepID=UPI003803A925
MLVEVVFFFGGVAAGVDVDVGRVLDRVLGEGDPRWSSTMVVSLMGTKDSFMTNMPV